jgi:hypothetical protein
MLFLGHYTPVLLIRNTKNQQLLTEVPGRMRRYKREDIPEIGLPHL